MVAGAVRTVPLSAPGDMVDEAGALHETSPARAVPPCPLFGACGGCRLQHLADDAYAAWTLSRVTSALARRGLEGPVSLARSPLASRRRFAMRILPGGARRTIGYSRRASNEVINVERCPALAPALSAALPAIRAAAAAAVPPHRSARLAATLCDNGVDLAITLDPARKRGKSAPAAPVMPGPDIVRLTVDGALEFMAEAPVIRLGGALVTPPPGAFLQATREGEAALTHAVVTGTAGATRVMDAYCGVGTFSLPLAKTARVTAVDGNAEAIAALNTAARGARGLKPIIATVGDLHRHPPSAKTLNGFDAVVFDPPRAGAEGLAKALAQSAVPRVVAVSCEPATFARDLTRLVTGGYKITQVLAVDQFVATAHIEAVATLSRV